MSSRRSKLQVSDVLGGRYRIVSVLGSGGMGTVYLADDLKLQGKQWAIKETVIANQDVQQFIDEAQMLVQLNHPLLPNIIDYYPPDQEGLSYLVMDYIKGHTLQDIFLRADKQMVESSVVHYALQLCEVFQYLHHEQPHPIVYRDLKPANIMIDEQNMIRLIDFGIARSFKEGKDTDTVQIGTIGFAAPEQFENQQTDNRTDLYALGALMYYLLSGGKYYYVLQKPLEQVQQGLNAHLYPIIQRLLQTSPANRYQRVVDVKQHLMSITREASYQAAASQHVQDALQQSRNIRGLRTLAITSVSPGVGSTHQAFMIASFLAANQAKVAVVEANYSEDFANLEAVYEGIKVQHTPSQTTKFEMRGVMYYKSNSAVDMIKLRAAAYDYIILDIGYHENNEWMQEFLRADQQLVIASASEWKRASLLKFSNQYRTYDQSRWIYLVPLADERMIRDMKADLTKQQLIAMPCQTDPFEMKEEGVMALESLFGESTTIKRKSPLFKRIFTFK
ncbi:serine/threonine-protein kinase [Paenibacillus sp. N1-5-1-14]|uniref:serine/threonine protein kinase n=1 Tax=Paenibacillus radicibacter TaxID=2972488 RepID=UPI0021592BE1|nr:serine/threonine-protein kinase [Paenibacillus radicibacter]MCR8643932.1 serine/threonine-protein kinase [Paenibacillus radicibacter]